ncbi:MAG: FKBP-type peptidyl-prolyl cis-trans isomerase [Flavobacteriales bacterium]
MKSILLAFSILLLFACNGKNSRPVTDQEIARAQKEMIEENKRRHNDEMKTIRDFISKNNWPMQESPTGLQFWVYEKGMGEQAQKDDYATISYTISLLDGTICYTASDAEPKEVHIEHDNIESGLREALQLMHAGDRAKFIAPSHLAFGFTGDSGKIPQNASVIYDIHLINLHP